MNKSMPNHLEQEKLLYKLVIQFLIYCQGSHKLLEPHLMHISKRLKTGADLSQLTPELLAISKTLLHISKQNEQSETELAHAGTYDYLVKRIDELLLNNDVPYRFQQKKLILRQKFKSNADDQSFNKVFDSAIALLLDIKDYAISEQKGIEEFLKGLSDQLGKIEQHAEYVEESTRVSMDNRQQLSDEINLQVDDMKLFTNQAVELTTLKSTTNTHLDQLMKQIVEHKQVEDDRQRQAEQQIALMTEKLQALEAETEGLRTKLKIEHDRALRDPLTGLPNRLAYKDRVEMETNRWRRYRIPLALSVWDVDFFKRINDTYGHKAGDKTLALVGQLLLNNCRSSDFVARYGGEEFVMLMPNTQASQAMEMAENIRELIANRGFNYNGEDINLTLSCGISEFCEGDQHDDVFIRADRALYQAKQSGRNCCMLFGSEFID